MLTVNDLTQIISQYLPEPHAGLLSGISFGTRAVMSKDLVESLIATGTLHIVALSGMNISIVAGMVSSTLLRFVGRRIASLLTILVVIGFVRFVGPSASVVRAAIMGALSLLAIILGRSNWPLFTWFLAVAAMLLLNPPWVGDLSFQLSALATLGIILFGSKAVSPEVANRNLDPSSNNSFRGSSYSSGLKSEAGLNFVGSPAGLSMPSSAVRSLWQYLRLFFGDDLRVTLAAQVFTTPLIFLHFHRVSLISPLPNILIGWVIGPLTILGWIVGFTGVLFEPVGQVVAWVAWVPLQYVLWVVTTASLMPFASVNF